MNRSDPTLDPRAWQPVAPGQGFIGRSSRNLPVPWSVEIERVIALPWRPVVEDRSAEAAALIGMITARYALPPAPCRCQQIQVEAGRRGPGIKPCIRELRLAQAWGLYEAGIAGGLFGTIGVGHGKTLLGLLLPLALRARTTALLVPPKLVPQVVLEYRLAAQHFWVPALVVHGQHACEHPVAGAPVLHLMPYSLISQKGYTDWFTRTMPDAVVADEAQRLRNPDCATTSRVMRHVHATGCMFACYTGTPTDQAADEYFHLVAMALREQIGRAHV